MGTRIALLVSVVLASLSIAVDCTAKPKKRPNERKVAWNIRLLIARYRSMVSPFLQRGRPERRAEVLSVLRAERPSRGTWAGCPRFAPLLWTNLAQSQPGLTVSKNGA
jgi:hypothetical protein